jgi:thymidine phosphorylase
MLSSTKLKEIVAEARPVIERMLDDAELIKGFREVVTANGGEWSSLKALLKAQVEDERDDAGDGKRVRKILDKADFAAAYADMLGLNLNEEN